MPDGDQKNATALLGQIPFDSVIGGPLKAAVAAQGQAAIASADFIKSVGFQPVDKNKPDAPLDPVNVTFSYTQGPSNLNEQPKKLSLTVPILTILPIPYLRIDTMTLDFKTSINSTTEASSTETSSFAGEGSLKAQVGWGIFSASLSGSLSSKKDSTSTKSSRYSVEYTIDVNVHAVQDDMPAGMAKVLNILTDAITAKPAS
jgi:Protein of unknown function (DUF2589)